MAGVDAKDLFGVKGMVVCITGGGTGIGRMMTMAFAFNAAHKVYVVGRRKEKLDETAQLKPETIIPLVGDVTSKESLIQVAEQVQKDAGFLNLLCVNSGTMSPAVGVNSSEVSLQGYQRKALEQKEQDWAQTFATNTSAIFFTTMAFLHLLDAGNKQSKDSAPGRTSQVLVTSSNASFLRNPASLNVYPTSKAAATHLVKHLSGVLVPYSIRVNAIAPGLFPSDLASGLIQAGGGNKELDPSEEGAFEKSFIPAQRLGSQSDMAGTVLYMSSRAGSYMNGSVHLLDGGRLGISPSTY
jgi:NAD(P)-dependent dehydrogenase (short-subunit alcohol dehydrogenase family)